MSNDERDSTYGQPCWVNNLCPVREEELLDLTVEQQEVIRSALCHAIESGLEKAGLAMPSPLARVGLTVASKIVGQICEAYDREHGLNQSEVGGG